MSPTLPILTTHTPRAGARSINAAGWANQVGISPSHELPTPNPPEKHAKYGDNQIQTLLFAEAMERKLSALREDAHLTRQETGVKTLYTAFGFLEWYETKDSEEARFLPLFLLPVDIDRELKQNRHRYFIETSDEAEAIINVSLQERLKHDFGLELPQLVEGDGPEAYLARVRRAIRSLPRWIVCRFVVIGHFSFARLVMYQDLAANQWQGRALDEIPLLSTLLAGISRCAGRQLCA